MLLVNRPPPLPFTFCYDELRVSPIDDLPEQLAAGRARGVAIVAGAQSLAQLEALYSREGEDALSLFRTVVIFRGIKDRRSFELLSKLGGEYWQEVHSFSDKPDKPGMSENVNYQTHMHFTEAQIAQGHPHLPDAAMILNPQARMSWTLATPYYRGEPWPRILINSAEHAFAEGLCKFPLPPLSKYGYQHLEALGDLADRFRALEARWPS